MAAPLTFRQNLIARLVAVPTAALVASHIVFYRRFPWHPVYQFPWLYFLTVATVMLSCWEVNLAVFRWLDQRFPFYRNPSGRILRQILYGGLLTMLAFSLVFPLAIRLYGGEWPSVDQLLSGSVVCATIATLANGAYVGLYLLQTIRWEKQQAIARQAPQVSLTPKPMKPSDLILIDTGTRKLRLLPSEIAYFYSTAGMVLLVKTDGQQVPTTYSSFAKLDERLPAHQFFQLSRQFIVSLYAIRSVADEPNRKLAVTLAPSLHKNTPLETVTVSRYRSPEFKKWFQHGSLT
ncbi:LytR/AlgR family response regulator transcription factor [Fibrisoma limi]|nr:LytTR family DNA-binding domain-containing protein [Fibrisoma limi]